MTVLPWIMSKKSGASECTADYHCRVCNAASQDLLKPEVAFHHNEDSLHAPQAPFTPYERENTSPTSANRAGKGEEDQSGRRWCCVPAVSPSFWLYDTRTSGKAGGGIRSAWRKGLGELGYGNSVSTQLLKLGKDIDLGSWRTEVTISVKGPDCKYGTGEVGPEPFSLAVRKIWSVSLPGRCKTSDNIRVACWLSHNIWS